MPVTKNSLALATYAVFFLIILAVNLLTADSDNLVFMGVKFGAVPSFVIAAGTRRSYIRVRTRTQIPYAHSANLSAVHSGAR